MSLPILAGALTQRHKLRETIGPIASLAVSDLSMRDRFDDVGSAATSGNADQRPRLMTEGTLRERKAMKAPANLAEKLATFTDRFSPRTVATYNNNDIMVAKIEGPFHWHKHDETDDFFLVLKGTLDIELRDRTVTSAPARFLSCPPASSTGRWRMGKYTYF
jgi:mannose-6-phosphate isomerase-like protein (cupin superfamily)